MAYKQRWLGYFDVMGGAKKGYVDHHDSAIVGKVSDKHTSAEKHNLPDYLYTRTRTLLSSLALKKEVQLMKEPSKCLQKVSPQQ